MTADKALIGLKRSVVAMQRRRRMRTVYFFYISKLFEVRRRNYEKCSKGKEMNTKLIMIVFVIGCIGSMLISCNNPANELLKDILNISADQASEIENQFSEREISIVAINPSENTIVSELDQTFEAYDVTADDGTQYLLIVRAEDKDYCAILDGNLEIIDGAIDNTMFPSFY